MLVRGEAPEQITMNMPYTKTQALRRMLLRLFELLGRRSAIYQLQDGTPFVWHLRDELASQIFVGRAYEPVETRFLRRFLERGDICIDAGANIGFMTKVMSECIGLDGTVISIEASPSTFAKLHQTLTLLNMRNIIPCCFALWNEAGAIGFNVSTSGNDAQQSIGIRTKLEKVSLQWPVAACTLDDVVEVTLLPSNTVAMVKIDVEGVEPAVLQGAGRLLAAPHPPAMLVEYNAEALLSCGFCGSQLLDVLHQEAELYFTPLCWPPWWSEQSRFQRFHEALPDECNLLVVPRRGVFGSRARAVLGEYP